MVEPLTIALIASLVGAAAGAGGSAIANKKSKKSSKKTKKEQAVAESRRAKESHRETKESLFEDALKRSAELKTQRSGTANKFAKSKASASQNTSNLIREALNI